MRPYTDSTKPFADKGLVNSRQEKIIGFSLEANQSSKCLVIGGGAIGCHASQGLIRKGYGEIVVCDGDTVDASNTPRQLFGADDIGMNKAICLARRLASEGPFPGVTTGYPCDFQDLRDAGKIPSGLTVIVCGPDNDLTRVAAQRHGIAHSIPVIHAGIARDASWCWVFVYEPGKACLACEQPDVLNDASFPCGLPGAIDVAQIVGGLIAYAADTIAAGRRREWNYASICLDGFLAPVQTMVPRKPNCPLCAPEAGHAA